MCSTCTLPLGHARKIVSADVCMVATVSGGMQVQEKRELALQKEALEQDKEHLQQQLAELESKLAAPRTPARHDAVSKSTAESPLAAAVMHAAHEAACKEPRAQHVTSASIIGTSDKVQAALQDLQGTLAAASESLGMQSSTEAAVGELRQLCLQLRRQLVKTVGKRADEMEAALRSVLAWANDAQVRWVKSDVLLKVVQPHCRGTLA